MSRKGRRLAAMKSADFWMKVFAPISVLGVWEVAARSGFVDPIFFPAPSDIGRVWLDSLTNGSLLFDVLVSLKRVTLGYLLGVGLGLVVAIGMTLSRRIKLFANPLITVLYPIPKVAILPLLLLWLGTGDLTKIVVVATGAFFPVAINTFTAVKGVDPILIRAARNLSADDRQLFRHVILPGILPGIYTGALLGASLSLVLLVYAEMTAADSGLGFFTYSSVSLFQTEQAFAGVFTIALLGWLWYRVINLLEAWHCPWQDQRR